MHTCTFKVPLNGSLDYTFCLCQAVRLLTHQVVTLVLCKLTSLHHAHVQVGYKSLSDCATCTAVAELGVLLRALFMSFCHFVVSQ
jgi:hypothetical protein